MQGTLANEPMVAEPDVRARIPRGAGVLADGDRLRRASRRLRRCRRGSSCDLSATGEAEAGYACMREAFRDHWGGGIAELDDWLPRARGDAHARPAPVDAGLARAASWPARSSARRRPRRIPTTATSPSSPSDRAFRRRGLGETLLRQSFAQFHSAGRQGVILFVDSDSPTGATRLYERVGMTSRPRFATWIKQLRPGGGGA